jgi:alpha-ketoglutarate-dependent taurine dioxygenase
VGANLGAEIGGVDLRHRLADETFNVILDALVENELLIFRNQDISSDDLITFGQRFGELTVHPFSPHDEKAPVLIKFRNDETNPPFGTDVWHSDETFRAEPPTATILRQGSAGRRRRHDVCEHVGCFRRSQRAHEGVDLRARSNPRLETVPSAVRQ